MSRAQLLGLAMANTGKNAKTAGHGGAIRIALITADARPTRCTSCPFAIVSSIAVRRESLRRSQRNGVRPEFWKR
ncbi:MAG: hypothetical protein R3E01_04575 [Pirellulaceae bacterium]|nr:hypothetical protein [Planctomycetales bacterium]